MISFNINLMLKFRSDFFDIFDRMKHGEVRINDRD